MPHNELLRLVVLQPNLEDVQSEGGHGYMLSRGSCQYHAKATMQKSIHCFLIQRLQWSFELTFAQTSGLWIQQN